MSRKQVIRLFCLSTEADWRIHDLVASGKNDSEGKGTNDVG